MFTRQTPAIHNSLLQAGIPGPQASSVQNLVGQCRAELVHRGPVTFDGTRPNMRLITPDLAKYVYPDLQLPTPVPLPGRPGAPPEEPFDPPFPAPGPEDPPGNPGDTYNFYDESFYEGGSFISVDQSRRLISLRADPSQRHAVFSRGFGGDGSVGSVGFEGSSSEKQYLDISIKENPDKTVVNLDVKQLERTYYVGNIDTSTRPPDCIAEVFEAHVFEPRRRPDMDKVIAIPEAPKEVRLATTSGPWDCGTERTLTLADTPEGAESVSIEGVLNLLDNFPDKGDDYKVIIASDNAGKWYVIAREPQQCCEAKAAADIGEESTEDASIDLVSEGDDGEAPQVLMNVQGCARWVKLKMFQVVGDDNTGEPDSIFGADGNGGLKWKLKTIWGLPESSAAMDKGLPCDFLGIVYSSATVNVSHGTGTVTFSHDCEQPKSFTIDIALDTTECPTPPGGG